MAIILLAFGPCEVIVNFGTFMSIPRVDGLSTDPRVLGRHKKGTQMGG